MKKELITTAKTVEEAIAEAAAQLKVEKDALTVEVLDEGKKGLFGIGATPAKVKVVYRLSGEEVAMEFIRSLVADMELNVTVTSHPGDNDDTVICVDGEDAGVLIGHHGDTLDSLQYLANLAANKKEEGEKRAYTRITLDIENYRAKREETLRALARRMADKVLKYKKSVMLEPMNPYERHIIHSEVQEIAGVCTNSIGSDNNRKIVIYLDDENDAAEESEYSYSPDDDTSDDVL